MSFISPDRLQTLAIHGDLGPDPETGALVTPIVQSTTFAQAGVGEHRGFTYSRAHNPTVSALEIQLAALEGARHCAAFATGMAAITGLALSVLRAGDHVVCSDVVYGGTVRLLERVLRNLGIRTTFVDTSDIDATWRAFEPSTRLVLVESPANPTLKLTDIAAVAGLAHDANALCAVDNTFLTSVLQRPIELGADVVVYSTTKFIEGHNTTVGGAVLLDDDALAARLDEVRKTVGSIQSPFDAWLTLKGLKTLPLRMAKHSENAARVAAWLETHSAVAAVAYPGLVSFPQADLARRQQASGGGVLAFEVVGGADAGVAAMNALELCHRAENLGATETLATHPVSMTHGDVDPEHRQRVGITDGLVRLSVGLEAADDIIGDLDRALATLKTEVVA
ncbi:MAG: cystathionine gamma-synthase [Deltaproteobacteria bacterium]|nr:cystathionine gamma-synthase [Deltaproteobacteria bacterium]